MDRGTWKGQLRSSGDVGRLQGGSDAAADGNAARRVAQVLLGVVEERGFGALVDEAFPAKAAVEERAARQ